jgi:hypothetical protein
MFLIGRLPGNGHARPLAIPRGISRVCLQRGAGRHGPLRAESKPELSRCRPSSPPAHYHDHHPQLEGGRASRAARQVAWWWRRSGTPRATRSAGRCRSGGMPLGEAVAGTHRARWSVRRGAAGAALSQGLRAARLMECALDTRERVFWFQNGFHSPGERGCQREPPQADRPAAADSPASRPARLHRGRWAAPGVASSTTSVNGCIRRPDRAWRPET